MKRFLSTIERLHATSSWSGIFGVAWFVVFLSALFVETDPFVYNAALAELGIFLGTASFLVSPQTSGRTWRSIVKTTVLASLALGATFAVLAVGINRWWGTFTVDAQWPILAWIGATAAFALGRLINPVRGKARYVAAAAVAMVGGVYFKVKLDWWSSPPVLLTGYGIIFFGALTSLGVSFASGLSARVIAGVSARSPGRRSLRNFVFALVTGISWWRWVIAVVGILILAVFVFTNVHHHRHRVRMMETHRLIRNNAKVIEHYRRETGEYPLPGYIGSAEGLGDVLSSYGALFHPEDGWRRPFLYSNSADGQDYTLLSGGSNATVEFTGEPYWPPDRDAMFHTVDVVIRNRDWFSFYGGITGYQRITLDERFLEQLKEEQTP